MKSGMSPLFKLLPLLWLSTHPKQKSALQTVTSRTPQSLLTEYYWSGSASALGLNCDFDPSQTGLTPLTYPAVVKYGFIPVSSQPTYKRLPVESRPESEVERAKNAAKSGDIDNYYREN